MYFGMSTAHRFGFEARSGHDVWVYPLATAGLITIANLLLAWWGLVSYGYFSPYVAASAAFSARICVRAGLLTAVLSILCWDLFVVPPPFALHAPSLAEFIAWTAAVTAALLTAPRISSKQPPDARRLRDPMPFVRLKPPENSDDKRDASCWDVARTGHWDSDDQYGQELGRLWVDGRQTRRHGTPPLAFVIDAMIHDGRFSGVEAGFATAVERAAAYGGHVRLQALGREAGGGLSPEGRGR